jgi:hypothetical protein
MRNLENVDVRICNAKGTQNRTKRCEIHITNNILKLCLEAKSNLILEIKTPSSTQL